MGPPVDQGYRNKSELTLARPPSEGRIHSLLLMAISFVSAAEETSSSDQQDAQGLIRGLKTVSQFSVLFKFSHLTTEDLCERKVLDAFSVCRVEKTKSEVWDQTCRASTSPRYVMMKQIQNKVICPTLGYICLFK